MMLPDKEYRDMEAYINDLLPRQRKERFEEKLKNDPAFKARFEELYPVITGLSDLAEEKQMRDLVTAEPTAVPKMRMWKTLPRFAAAAIVILVSIVAWDSSQSFRLFNNRNKPLLGIRSAVNEECPTPEVLKIYQEDADYKQFLTRLESFNPTPCISLYKGLAYLGLGNYKEAVPFLEAARSAEDKETRNNADWYLAVANIRIDEKISMKILEEIINTPGHQYGNPAKSLLTELQKKPILFKIKF